MPAIAPGSKVLLTGANGFIAVWILKYLLEKGYYVRGTIRSEEKGTHLKKLFGDYGEKFEIVIVPDITVPGAFDESVKGVDAILHTSSPFHLRADDPEEIITPAVKGTVGVLESSLKNATNLKRVVVLSSNLAVNSGDEIGRVTEDNWNTKSLDEVKTLGRSAPQISKYRASKILAERAAWEFISKNKGSISWDLVTLCPPGTYGPMIHDVTGPPSTLNLSSLAWYGKVFAGNLTEQEYLSPQSRWVDVRDLAVAHILALEVEKAGGERFLVSAWEYVWQDFLDVINSIELPIDIKLPSLVKGNPGSGKTVKYQFWLDTSKAKEVLGLPTFRTKEETTKDILVDYHLKGWI